MMKSNPLYLSITIVYYLMTYLVLLAIHFDDFLRQTSIHHHFFLNMGIYLEYYFLLSLIILPPTLWSIYRHHSFTSLKIIAITVTTILLTYVEFDKYVFFIHHRHIHPKILWYHIEQFTRLDVIIFVGFCIIYLVNAIILFKLSENFGQKYHVQHTLPNLMKYFGILILCILGHWWYLYANISFQQQQIPDYQETHHE